MYTQNHAYNTYTCVYILIYTHIYVYTHTEPTQTGTLSTQTNTNSINGLILFPCLADEGEDLLVENMYMHVYICATWNPPAAGLRHLVCSWITVSPFSGTWTYKTLRPPLVQNHTHARFPSSWPWTLSRSYTSSWILPRCLTLTNTHIHTDKACFPVDPPDPRVSPAAGWDTPGPSNSQLSLRDMHTPLSPWSFHLLTG